MLTKCGKQCLSILLRKAASNVNTDMGSTGIAKYLENHGIHKIARQNGKNPLFDAALIRKIIQNPVYCGKIVYGRRKTEKVIGTRNDYHMVPQDDCLLVEGLYIKFNKLENCFVIVISFHEQKYPLTYYFR